MTFSLQLFSGRSERIGAILKIDAEQEFSACFKASGSYIIFGGTRNEHTSVASSPFSATP